MLQACHIGSAEGCKGAAELMGKGAVPEGRDTVRSLIDRACALGNAEACAAGKPVSRTD